MISFFRKIRLKLAAENRFLKYSRYALGEVVLIIVGIFIALQLQNWNEKRLQEKRFKIVLEQIFNSIQGDIEGFEGGIDHYDRQSKILDTLLSFSDHYPQIYLPYIFNDLTSPSMTVPSNEIMQHMNNLEYSTDDKEQNELARQIARYIEGNKTFSDLIKSAEDRSSSRLQEVLIENNIPLGVQTSEDMIDKYIHLREGYYSESEIETCRSLLDDDHVKSLLKSIFMVKTESHIMSYNRFEDAVSIKKMIKAYHPKVKIIFSDVGIIGSAISGWLDTSSTPMILTNIEKNIWELEIVLKKGLVKFRCRDSWSQNWGGSSFPEGEAAWFGPDIPIPEAGNYHVVLDLSNNTYRFTKLD